MRKVKVELTINRNKNSFLLSLLAHTVLALLVLLFLNLHLPPIASVPETIEIEVINPNRDESKSKQIVTAPKSMPSDEAKKDSYLSDQNRVTDREKSARSPGINDTSVAQSQKHDARPAQPKTETHKQVTLSDLGLKFSLDQPKKNYQTDRNWAPTVQGESLKGGEYIKGLEQADSSVLNTKEFVFYSYFERVRKQLDSAWQPMLREQVSKIYRRGRKLSSDSDYTTKTLVTLNKRGEIVRVQVLEASGTTDLDDVAIDALNRAGPYPNPPSGLVDASGKIEIRWDFILKT